MEFAEGAVYVPVPIEESEGESPVGLGQRGIKRNGAVGGGDSAWKRNGVGHLAVLGKKVVGFGEAGVGAGVIVVVHDGLGVGVECFLQASLGTAVPVVPATKGEFGRLR